MTTAEKTGNGSSMALGMIFGAMAGIGAGILMAPRSGAETRKQLKARAAQRKEAAMQKVKEKHNAAMDTVKNSIDKSKDAIGKLSDKAAGTAENMAEEAKMGSSSNRRRNENA